VKEKSHKQEHTQRTTPFSVRITIYFFIIVDHVDTVMTRTVEFFVFLVSAITMTTTSVSATSSDFSSNIHGKERCRLCPDGAKYELVDAMLPSMVLPTYNQTLTCNDLQLAMLALDADSTRCRDLQSANAGYCACVDTGPLYECSFCKDEYVPTNLDATISATGDLCRTLYTYVEYLPQDQCQKDIFNDISKYASECGCPEVDEGNDEDEDNDDQEEENEEQDVDLVELRSDGDKMSPLRIEDIPPAPDTFRQTMPCTFCPDGTFPPDPSIELELFQGGTCGEYAQFVNGLKPPECQLQSSRGTFELFAYQCGCPNSSPPACSLRENSELCTVALLDSVQERCECYNFCDGEFVGCAPWPGNVMGDTCQGTPISGCNYASAIDDSGSCHMCPDFTNDISNPNGIIPPFSGISIPGNPAPTCQDVVNYMEQQGTGSGLDCDIVQTRLSYYCGCEGIHSPSCTLCPGGIQPSFGDKIATGDVTCAEFAGTVTTWERATCEIGRDYLQVMAARCGCITASWPQCPIQQNPLLCTANLLRKTDTQCECYNFCGDKFLGCADYPGQILDESDCPEGVELISGCNRALATNHRCRGGRESITCPPPPSTTTPMLRTRQ
jgi:hypothetical protein